MFDYVIKKINGTIKFLYRNRSFMKTEVRKMLVNSLIQPWFDYACNLWYRPIGKTKQLSIQRCQNKSIQFIMNLPSRHHMEFKLFKELKYLNVHKRVEYLTLCSAHAIINNNSPKYMHELINTRSHKHNTRSGTNSLYINNVKSHGKLSFGYNASCSWNKLASETKSIVKKVPFKMACKKYLVNSMEVESKLDFIFY